MCGHDMITLDKGTTVIFGGHAALQKVGEDGVGIGVGQRKASTLLQDADTPIIICRKTIVKIIWRTLSYVCTSVKGLMANEHPVGKRLPREIFWRRQMTGAKESAGIVYNVGMAIHHGGQQASPLCGRCSMLRMGVRNVGIRLRRRKGGKRAGRRQFLAHATSRSLCYDGQRIGTMEFIARIKKYDIIARGQKYGFVHGIIETIIWFGKEREVALRTLATGIALLILPYKGERLVGRASVHDNMLNKRMRLLLHTPERALQ